MKLSKLFVGFVAALVLSGCNNNPPVEHTITFHYNYNYGDVAEGEPEPTTIKVNDGETVDPELIPSPTREGEYRFKRWCTTPACVDVFNWEKVIDKDYNVYADWVDLTNADIITMVGGFGGEDNWNPNSDTYKFHTDDGIIYKLEDVLIKQYVEFQVIKNHAWDGQMGVDKVDDATDKALYEGTGNIKILKSAYYDITVDLSAVKQIHIDLVEEYEEVIAGYNVYIAGQDAFTGIAWGVNEAGKMDGPADELTGTWTKTITLTTGQIKLIITKVNDQGVEDTNPVLWMGASKLTSKPSDWTGDDNVSVTAGTYTFTCTIPENMSEATFTVTAA